MRLIFYLCPDWPLWDTLNWSMVEVPRKGGKFTFSTSRGDKKGLLVIGEVVHVEEIKEESREEYAKVCMDMGETTQALQNGLVKIDGWTKYNPPPKPS